MHVRLTAVPVLRAQSRLQDKDIWLENEDMISCEKSRDDVRPTGVDFRPVMSSIGEFRDAKESVRRRKLNPDFGCRYRLRSFRRAAQLMSREMAS